MYLLKRVILARRAAYLLVISVLGGDRDTTSLYVRLAGAHPLVADSARDA